MTGFATGQTGTGLPHSVFLRRLAGTAEPPGLEPRLGRAAFLVLRLVDLLGPGHDGLHPDAFRYQRIATERCCRDLPPTSTEANHLLGLVEGKSIWLEEYARQMIFQEEQHAAEVDKMLRRPGEVKTYASTQ